jgi:hypothetical protein
MVASCSARITASGSSAVEVRNQSPMRSSSVLVASPGAEAASSA